jgi:ABC-2 type transport system ATP-binding protein
MVNSVDPVMEFRGVVKRYGATTALDRVDLALRSGEVTAVLGPNGAGKTTAVRLLLGLSRPSEGTVRVLGGDPSSSAIRMRTGAMMQISSVPGTLRVGEHIGLFSSYYPAPLPRAEVLSVAGLDGLERRPFGKLSGGQQRRLQFALAICGNPELLFLDEPTVGLDVAARRTFWSHIRTLAEAGRTILLTTHYLEEADALADRVVVLHRGAVVADGSPEEIKASALGRKVRARTRLVKDDLAQLSAIPGVRRIRRDGELLEALTSNPETLVRELLGRDPDLTDLEVSSAGLEEAFLDLTDNENPASEQISAQRGAA